MDIGSRILRIRKEKGLSQADFGSKIGTNNSSISKLEKNINNPSEQTIRAICSEFRVNRYWLETGEGDPYLTDETNDELAQQIRIVMKGRKEFAVAVLSALASMPDEYWDAFHQKVLEAYDAMKKEEDK